MSEIKKFLDNEGLKFLWQKISMEDYPNNDTLVAIINAIDQNKADKSEIKQSDWNQANENEIDYIKNKPVAASDEEILNSLISLNMAPMVSDTEGFILVDENNAILLM